jgi:hypothetical protein
MTDGKKGFIWGAGLMLLFVLVVHSCNSDTPAVSSGNPTAPAQVDTTSGGGTGSGPNGMYEPPSNLNPPTLPFIPSAPPAELAPEPAQAAPAPALAAPSPQ